MMVAGWRPPLKKMPPCGLDCQCRSQSIGAESGCSAEVLKGWQLVPDRDVPSLSALLQSATVTLQNAVVFPPQLALIF
jgi:hypothetical protein